MTIQENSDFTGTNHKTTSNDHRAGIGTALRGLIAAAGLLMPASAAQAQHGTAFHHHHMRYYSAPVPVSFPVAVPFAVYGAAYAQNSQNMYAISVADVIRAEGEYNLKMAQAQLVMQDVQARQVVNRTNAIHDYYERKEEWHARQIAKRQQQMQRLERQRPMPDRPVQETVARVPRRDAPAERNGIDLQAVKITWPNALLANDYAAQRTELDLLLLSRTDANDSPNQLNRIRADIQELTAQLKDNIKKLPTGDYIQARKFLDRLASTVNHG